MVDIDAGMTENLRRIAKVKRSSVSDVDRLHPGPAPARRPGRARSATPAPGSGSSPTATSPGAISAAREQSDVDVLMGIGGTPEGIVAACALKCMGGAIQAKLWPRDDAEREKALAAGHDLDRVLHTDDLVSGDNVFFAATGVTSGDLLRGVRYRGGGAYTQSIVMRSKSGTIRVIDSYHRLEKLRRYSLVDFDGLGRRGRVRPGCAARRPARSGAGRTSPGRPRSPARTAGRTGSASRPNSRASGLTRPTARITSAGIVAQPRRRRADQLGVAGGDAPQRHRRAAVGTCQARPQDALIGAQHGEQRGRRRRCR